MTPKQRAKLRIFSQLANVFPTFSFPLVIFLTRSYPHTDFKDFKEGYAAWRLHVELHTLEYFVTGASRPTA